LSERRDVLRQLRPDGLVQEQHGGLSGPHRIHPLLRVVEAPEEKPSRRPVFVLADLELHADGPVEPVGGERGGGFRDEFLHLGGVELVEELREDVRVRRQRDGPRDAPPPRLRALEVDGVLAHDERDMGHVVPFERDDGPVPVLPRRPRPVPREALGEHEHGGRAVLPGVDPRPGGALRAEAEPDPFGPPLHPERHVGFGSVEPELAERARRFGNDPVHPRAGQIRHEIVDGGARGRRPDRLEHLPAIRGPLEAHRVLLALDDDLLDVLRLDGPEAALLALGLLATRTQVGDVVEVEAGEQGEQEPDNRGRLPPHGDPGQLAAGIPGVTSPTSGG